MSCKIIDISRDYRFCIGSVWDECKAQSVCLPHTVKLTPANSSGCRNYQGECIYQKDIYIPSEYRNKKVLIEFEGAMGVSVLYVNSVKVAEHFCGYTPFVVDLSDHLVYGENNTFRITLDNRDNADVPPGKPQSELDFTYDGGLYRKATLSVFDRLYITHPLLADEIAGGGIFVHYEDVSEEGAKVCVRTQIMNEFDDTEEYVLKLTLRDSDGKTVCTKEIASSLAPAGSEYIEYTFDVENPHLWSIDTPYIYTLTAQILRGDEVSCEKTEDIGIRTFTYTVDDGVIFNGKSHRFSGVNYHMTWPYIGNAVPDGLLRRDMIKLKEMGCENIRSHYPFGKATTDSCNHLGMTVIVSNPGWQFCHEGIFLDRAEQNMRDIIRWQRNNPCIILWEPILNESKMSYEIQLSFHQLVHEEYPYNDCYTASDYGPTDVSYKDYVPGMIGYADYGFIEKRDLTPTPIWTREYGDDPDNFTDQNTVWRMPRAFGDAPMVDSVNRMLKRYQKSEDTSVQYIDVYNNKKRCGYGVWPGISHNRGYHMNPCYGGHLDLFRVPKFSYYFMKCQQDREIVGNLVYIASWWSDVSPDDVTVYSNAEEVELICDGVSVARQKPDDVAVKHPPFTFSHVRHDFKARPYPERSRLTARAYVNGRIVAEQTVIAPGVPRKLILEPDMCGIPFYADGADILAVRCKVTDVDGTVVPLMGDSLPILFEIEGEGTIVGDSSIMANPVCPEAGIATVLIRSTQTAGKIRLRAHLLWDSITTCSDVRSTVYGDEIVISSCASDN